MSFVLYQSAFLLRLFVYRFAWELGIPRRLAVIIPRSFSYVGLWDSLCLYVGMTFSYLAFLLFYLLCCPWENISGEGNGAVLDLQFGFIFAHRKRGSGCDIPVYRQKYVSSVMNNCILNESCRVVIRACRM